MSIMMHPIWCCIAQEAKAWDFHQQLSMPLKLTQWLNLRTIEIWNMKAQGSISHWLFSENMGDLNLKLFQPPPSPHHWPQVEPRKSSFFPKFWLDFLKQTFGQKPVGHKSWLKVNCPHPFTQLSSHLPVDGNISSYDILTNWCYHYVSARHGRDQ